MPCITCLASVDDKFIVVSFMDTKATGPLSRQIAQSALSVRFIQLVESVGSNMAGWWEFTYTFVSWLRGWRIPSHPSYFLVDMTRNTTWKWYFLSLCTVHKQWLSHAFITAVVSMWEDHGAAGPKQDWPSPASGGDPQSGQFLQGADSRAEGEGPQRTVQLWSSRYVDNNSFVSSCVLGSKHVCCTCLVSFASGAVIPNWFETNHWACKWSFHLWVCGFKKRIYWKAVVYVERCKTFGSL